MDPIIEFNYVQCQRTKQTRERCNWIAFAEVTNNVHIEIMFVISFHSRSEEGRRNNVRERLSY